MTEKVGDNILNRGILNSIADEGTELPPETFIMRKDKMVQIFQAAYASFHHALHTLLPAFDEMHMNEKTKNLSAQEREEVQGSIKNIEVILNHMASYYEASRQQILELGISIMKDPDEEIPSVDTVVDSIREEVLRERQEQVAKDNNVAMKLDKRTDPIGLESF